MDRGGGSEVSGERSPKRDCRGILGVGVRFRKLSAKPAFAAALSQAVMEPS